jgi:hypothetical protein
MAAEEERQTTALQKQSEVAPKARTYCRALGQHLLITAPHLDVLEINQLAPQH